MKFENENKALLLAHSGEILERIWDQLAAQPELEMESLESQKTALIMVDLVNGFAKEGALQSDRVQELIPELVRLARRCDELGIVKLAFADAHFADSPEFAVYPPHCLQGTEEAEVVSELQAVGGYTLIEKNSTNGFLEAEFQAWLKQNSTLENFIITGDCTDLCVQQFALALKAWFNLQQRQVRVILPVNAVETYDFELHDGDLMNLMALYNMSVNGIEIVSKIK